MYLDNVAICRISYRQLGFGVCVLDVDIGSILIKVWSHSEGARLRRDLSIFKIQKILGHFGLLRLRLHCLKAGWQR